MTEETIVNALYRHRQCEIEMEILRDCVSEGFEQGAVNGARYKALQQRQSLINHWMALLSEEERIVIESHFIKGETWNDILNRNQKCKGKSIGADRRTLQRIKRRGIEKIQVFMNERFGQSLDHLLMDDEIEA